MARIFASLQYRNYRWWVSGALVASVGTWMQRVAQDWLVLTELSNDSGLAIGITTALQFAPALFFSAWAGSLADRMDRRKLLYITQGSQGVLAAVLGGLVMAGVAELWHVYVLAFLLGIASAFDAPVRQVYVSELVPRHHLANAVGLNSATFNTARLIGPAVAGLLIAAVGTGWVFMINAASFAATLLALYRINAADIFHEERTKDGRGGTVRDGLAYVKARSDIIVIFIVVSVVSTFGLNFQMTSALMARIEFERGASEYGILGSVLAIGSLAGALLAARRERPRVRLVIGSAFAFGVTTGILALMPTYPLFVIACIPVGFASLTMLTSANATLQLSTAPSMRGRVMALYMIVLLGATPIGAPFVGWVGEYFGPRWSIGIGSVSALLVSVWALWWTRRRWGVEVHYSLRTSPRLRVIYPPAPESDAAA